MSKDPSRSASKRRSLRERSSSQPQNVDGSGSSKQSRKRRKISVSPYNDFMACFAVKRDLVRTGKKYAHIADKRDEIFLCKVTDIDEEDEKLPFRIEYDEEQAELNCLKGGWIPGDNLLRVDSINAFINMKESAAKSKTASVPASRPSNVNPSRSSPPPVSDHDSSGESGGSQISPADSLQSQQLERPSSVSRDVSD
eukprot:748111_1